METKNGNTTTVSTINTVIMTKDEFETLSSKQYSDFVHTDANLTAIGCFVKSMMIRDFTISNLKELEDISCNNNVYFYRPVYNLSSFGFAAVDQQFFRFFKFLSPNLIFISYLNITIDVLIVINYDKSYAGWNLDHELTVNQLFEDNAFSIDVYSKQKSPIIQGETTMNGINEKKSSKCVGPSADNQTVRSDNRQSRLDLINLLIGAHKDLYAIMESDNTDDDKYFSMIQQLTAEQNRLIKKDDYVSQIFDQVLPLRIVQSNDHCFLCGERLHHNNKLDISLLAEDDDNFCKNLFHTLRYGVSRNGNMIVLHCCANNHDTERDTIFSDINNQKLTINTILDLRAHFED